MELVLPCLLEHSSGSLIAGFRSGTVRVWNLVNSTYNQTYDMSFEHTACIASMIELVDGLVASISVDALLKVWSTTKLSNGFFHEIFDDMQEGTETVSTLCQFTDGRLFSTCTYGLGYMWDIKESKEDENSSFKGRRCTGLIIDAGNAIEIGYNQILCYKKNEESENELCLENSTVKVYSLYDLSK